MKTIKTLAIVALLSVVGSAFAQNKKSTDQKIFELSLTKSEKTEFDQSKQIHTTIMEDLNLDFGKKKKKKNNRWDWYEGHYMGVNIHYNGLTGAASDPLTNLDTKSIGVDINLIDFVIFSYRRFGIVSGLGIESNNFRFNNSVSIKVNEDGFTVPDYQYRDAGVNLQKSKLTTTYLNVPLLFQFNIGRNATNHDQGWFSVGLVAGLRLQSYTKVVLPDGTKIKNFNNFNMSNFHWGAMASFGYHAMTFTAKYYPQNIFRADQGLYNEQFNFGFGLTF